MSYVLRYIESNEEFLKLHHSADYMYVENDAYIILGFDNILKSASETGGESEWQFTLVFLTPGVGVIWPIREPELSQITVAALVSFSLTRSDLAEIVLQVPNGELLLEIEKLYAERKELRERREAVDRRLSEIESQLKGGE